MYGGKRQTLTQEETLGVKVNMWKIDPSSWKIWFSYSLQDNPEFWKIMFAACPPRLLLSSQMGTYCNFLCRRSPRRFLSRKSSSQDVSESISIHIAFIFGFTLSLGYKNWRPKHVLFVYIYKIVEKEEKGKTTV